MEEPESILSAIHPLLESQSLAVLATDRRGHPYSSLVAFVASSDLTESLFATSRSTRKFENLRGNPRVSLLVDNRTHQPADFRQAEAVTILGEAHEVPEAERPACEKPYLIRHPQLDMFVRSLESVMVRVYVSVYYHVTRFQDVQTFHPGPLDM